MKKIHINRNLPISLYRRLTQINHWGLFALLAFMLSTYIVFAAWITVLYLISETLKFIK